MARTELLYLDSVDSTNAVLRRMNTRRNVCVFAGEQTAGRGQRGNVWHSAAGANLLMSLLWHPHGIAAPLQFALSEAVALSICGLLDGHGVDATVKWPNDIYVGHRKICGILIENGVSAVVESSIIGIGLNINQTEFPAALPNPVSLRLLTGAVTDVASVAGALLGQLEELLPQAGSEEGRCVLHTAYMSRLYRNDGEPHLYRDSATGREFHATIAGVEPTGHLLLRREDSSVTQRYAFKEVEFRIPHKP